MNTRPEEKNCNCGLDVNCDCLLNEQIKWDNKNGKLLIRWNKKEREFSVIYPNSSDGSFFSQIIRPWRDICRISLKNSYIESGYKEDLCYRGSLGEYTLLEKDWLKELDRRGYDLKTLKIEIKRKSDYAIKEKLNEKI